MYIANSEMTKIESGDLYDIFITDKNKYIANVKLIISNNEFAQKILYANSYQSIILKIKPYLD